MLTEKITLPLGLQYENNVYKNVEIRELTGHEEDMLVDAHKVQAGTIITDLLTACIVSFEDVKKIDSGKDSNIKVFRKMVDSMLQDDRTYTLVKIRQMSLGDEVTCQITCPSCSNTDDYTFILSDFAVKEFEVAPSYEKDIILPSGKKATIRLLTGKDDARMARIRKRNDAQLASALLQFHIIELDGVKAPPVNVLQGLSSRDRNALRKAINESSGGIDATLDIICTNCHSEFNTEVPIVGGDFFFPSGVQ